MAVFYAVLVMTDHHFITAGIAAMLSVPIVKLLMRKVVAITGDALDWTKSASETTPLTNSLAGFANDRRPERVHVVLDRLQLRDKANDRVDSGCHFLIPSYWNAAGDQPRRNQTTAATFSANARAW
jgi:hypothetical protein